MIKKKFILYANYALALCIGVVVILMISCKKDNTISLPTVNDIDGNVYHTITIGSQVWMMENLKVTHYRNGKSIANINDTVEWSDLSTGAYCDYLNDKINAITYGKLYNWYAIVDTSNICPDGWHIPSNAEWEILKAYLGGDQTAGGKLKEAGYYHWEIPNIGATNQSRFTGLPGGFRSSDGLFGYIQEYAYWWAADPLDISSAWCWGLSFEDPFLYKNAFAKSYGLSVRCVKD
jgi:uncharacterized protein (TIGR02145 family)